MINHWPKDQAHRSIIVNLAFISNFGLSISHIPLCTYIPKLILWEGQRSLLVLCLIFNAIPVRKEDGLICLKKTKSVWWHTFGLLTIGKEYHSSEWNGLCLIKWPHETLHNVILVLSVYFLWNILIRFMTWLKKK